MTIRPWNHVCDTAHLLRWYHADPKMFEDIGGTLPLDDEKISADVAMRCSHHAMCAIEDHGDLIGFVSVFPRLDRDSGVVHIGIARAYRGKGLEAARAALRYAQAEGYRHLIAPPAPRMDPRIHQAWLKRAGFTVKHHGEWHAHGS